MAYGIGFTVTIGFTAAPVQPAATGVNKYATVPAELVAADTVSNTKVPVPEIGLTPETFEMLVVQEKVVPATLLETEKETVSPEHLANGEVVAVATGIGLTVNTGLIIAPTHPAASGVT